MPSFSAHTRAPKQNRFQFINCPKRSRADLRHVSPCAEAVDWTTLNLWPGQAACGAIMLAWAVNKRPVGWSIDDVEVKTSPVSGKGVFARSRIEEGTAIGRFGGVLRTPDEVDSILLRAMHDMIGFNSFCVLR